MDTDDLTVVAYDHMHNCIIPVDLGDHMTIADAKDMLIDLISLIGWPASTYSVLIGPRESFSAAFAAETENRKRAACDFAAAWAEKEKVDVEVCQISYGLPGEGWFLVDLVDTMEKAADLAEQKLSMGYEVNVRIGKRKGPNTYVPGYAGSF